MRPTVGDAPWGLVLDTVYRVWMGCCVTLKFGWLLPTAQYTLLLAVKTSHARD